MRGRGTLLLLAVVGCSTESTRVREARDQFYAAITRYDQGAIRAAVTGDYLAVDRGRLFNLDSLLYDVTLLEQESLAVRYAFADSALRIDPPLAVVIYHSRRIATHVHSADTAFAVETATFRRDGGGWKLVVLHRTPIAATPEYFAADKAPAPTPAKKPADAPPPAAAVARPAAPRANPPPATTTTPGTTPDTTPATIPAPAQVP